MNYFVLRKKALILIGGSGQLGQSVVSKFRAGGWLKQWKVFNIDLVENPDAQANFLVDPTKPITTQHLDSLQKQLEDFDDEYDAIMNLAGLWYPPQNKQYMKHLAQSKPEGQEKCHHPFSLSSVDCFANYERIQQSEFLSTMLAVHLADAHLAPTGFFMLAGSRAALFGDRQAAPLEHVAKSTVMQQATNLSMNKVREDLVYENSCMAVFVPDRLFQDRNI